MDLIDLKKGFISIELKPFLEFTTRYKTLLLAQPFGLRSFYLK